MYKRGCMIFIYCSLVSVLFGRSVQSFENRTDRVSEPVISAKALCASLHCGRGQECLHRKFWCTNPPCPSMFYCSSTRREAQKGPTSCESVRCSTGYICLVKARKCYWDQRCRVQIARCVSKLEYEEDPASCVDIRCPAGRQCILKESPCAQPPCKLVRNCEQKKDVQMWHTRCRKLECPSEYECFVRRPPENCSSTETCAYTSDCMTANVHEFSPHQNCPGWVCPRHQTCVSTVPKSCDTKAGIDNCQAKRTCRGLFSANDATSSSSPNLISSTPATIAKAVSGPSNTTELPAPETTKATKRNRTRQYGARKGSPRNTWRDRALITTTINPFSSNNLNAVEKVRYNDSNSNYHRQSQRPLYPVNRLTSPADNPALASAWNQTDCRRNNSVQFETWKSRRAPIYQTPIYVRSIVSGNSPGGGKFFVREEPSGPSVTEWLDHLRLKTGVDAIDVWAKRAEENRGYKEFNEWLASVENALGPVQFETWFAEIQKLASEYLAFQRWLANQRRTSSGSGNKTNGGEAPGNPEPSTPQDENLGQKSKSEGPSEISGAANQTSLRSHEIPPTPGTEAEEGRIEDQRQITDPEKHFGNLNKSQRVPYPQLRPGSSVENSTEPDATTNALTIPTPEVTTLPQRGDEAKANDISQSGRRTDLRPNNRDTSDPAREKDETRPENESIDRTVQGEKPQRNFGFENPENGTLTGSGKNNSTRYRQKNVGTQTTGDESTDSSVEQRKNIPKEKSPNADTPDKRDKNVLKESVAPHRHDSGTDVEKKVPLNRNATTESIPGDAEHETRPDSVKVNDGDEFSSIQTTFAPGNFASPFGALFEKNGDSVAKRPSEPSTERSPTRQKDRGGPGKDSESPSQQPNHKTSKASDPNGPETRDKEYDGTKGKENPTKTYNLFVPASEDEFRVTSPWDILGVLDPEKRTYYSLLGFSPERVDNRVQIIRYPFILSRPAVAGVFNASSRQDPQNFNARPDYGVRAPPNSESFSNPWKFNPSERWVPILPRQQPRPRELGPEVPDPGIVPPGGAANFKPPSDQRSRENAGESSGAAGAKDAPRIDGELPRVLFIDALLDNFQKQLETRDRKDKGAREYFVLQTRNGRDEPYFTPEGYPRYKFHPSILGAEYPTPIVIPLQNPYPNRIASRQPPSAEPHAFFNPSSINGAVFSAEFPRIPALEGDFGKSANDPSPRDYVDAYIDFFIEDALPRMIFDANLDDDDFRQDRAEPEGLGSPSALDSSAENEERIFGNLEERNLKSSANGKNSGSNSEGLKNVQSTTVARTGNSTIESAEAKEEEGNADCRGENAKGALTAMESEDEESSILMETYRPYAVDDELVEYYYADSDQRQEEEHVEEEPLKFRYSDNLSDRELNESIHESEYYNDRTYYEEVIPDTAADLFPQP
ncbi:uncharacterized protein LOC105692378 isoform X1 [Athalia rosae]|uniref:uncharacterized protein LOC105692378 isoform X1 n=2 Tax=Athalia rosae TaxID=37344 RepID=UPI0020343E47|nr:uncharacterized protein LOC105692378 isoform X1 [Athalia rosae]